jgi:hypothetical protein
MKKPYNRPEWRAFRSEIIRLYDGICNQCQRRQDDGIVLQVHHKIYIAGRLPWQYKHDECEVLCRGCHAQEHGKIMPRTGWEHFGCCDDLGDLIGECELCGTPIRYVFPIYHSKWGTLEVGEICCDHLTSTSFATEHMEAHAKHMGRRLRFVLSNRWKKKSGVPCIEQKGISVGVVADGREFRLRMNGVQGKMKFRSVLEAKIAAFEIINSGKAHAYLSGVKKRAAPHQHFAPLPRRTKLSSFAI